VPINANENSPPSKQLCSTQALDTKKSEPVPVGDFQPSVESSNAVSYLVSLTSLLKNESAQFNSVEQCTAIQAIMSGKNALVVLPSGGGKTITYTLPAFIENRRHQSQTTPTMSITVLILPLVILKADQHRRLKEYDLKVKDMGYRDVEIRRKCTPLHRRR
jgi:superfamily II DNA helicase RecQ